MSRDVLGLEAIDATQGALVGGKGANLGELTRIDGVTVPPGFCLTTDSYRRILAEAPAIGDLLDRLAALDPGDQEAIRTGSGAIREAIEVVVIPDDLAAVVAAEVARVGADVAFAVRSSATAEDLPTASFAGQQDSYLNIVGTPAVLEHIRRCWASLFTERAVTYRLRHGIDHRQVHMAVVVQQMVDPEAAGVLFTADPVDGNRRVASVEAVRGLGEALVSGLVTPDGFTVRDGEVVASTHQGEPTLSDAQAVALVELGRRIEAHFGRPQDIEWCLVDGAFQIVQSRPITTLFPIPVTDDDDTHVYVSVGHQQMMTAPFKPLGLSLHQRIAGPPMHEAGGRLFVDVAMSLASPVTRDGIIDALGTSDPLIGGALQALVDRDGFLPEPAADAPMSAPAVRNVPLLPADDAIVASLIERTQASVAQLAQALDGLSGSELLGAIEADIPELKRILTHPESRPVIFAGIGAALWLDEHLADWSEDANIIDVVSLSAPGNVTAEMGLALLDVADAIRPHPEVVAFLRGPLDDGFLAELAALAGGPSAREAIDGFLATYGMRCVGEIDITRPRWSERPSALVPAILANVDGVEPGEAERRFERGRVQAEAKAAEVLEHLRALPEGQAKADEAEAMIARVRAFAGFREYPKYGYICRFGLWKRALVAEADRLVAAGILRVRDDAWFLRFEELQEVVRTQRADLGLIDERRAAHEVDRSLVPPRVFTSDGEVVTGRYDRDDVPEGALVGLAVSSGTVEGRARVILDLADAAIEPGDILVTTGTDPSWSPLFVSIAALVTEVGGRMTHGAVIAREYGLPAVVGVVGATQLIADGQRIRVHGTDGYIELLEP